MHFKKLKVHGFKSFVDPAELMISSGITGVVGPNGCGKSNVIESLRWVMGEASAKRMRGGEMDDVIFGGSSTRPQRNSAEVTVYLDNTERRAPAAFNDADELEILRRIDRGQGSTYRINGKEVRARDVQLLFADLATGANSTAIVSQGRVGALIGAKPQDRRTLLEEAAGIRGLHSRRHEAELRLKAAESNLERLEDVIGALESQFGGLQRQARQANRYRKIAEQLRAQEAILLHLRWTEAQAKLDTARQRLTEAEALVNERTQMAAQGANLQAHAHDRMPKLREAEAEAAARLQSQVIAERQLQDEGERIAAQLTDLRQRLDQISSDMVREETLASDAIEALERLGAERKTIQEQQASEKSETDRLRLERDDADKSVAKEEAKLDELNEHVAAVEAQRGTLTRQIDDSRKRLAALDQRSQAIAAETETLNKRIAEAGDVEGAKAAVEAAEAALIEARQAAEQAEETRAAAETKASDSRTALSAADLALRQELDTARNQARDSVSAAERDARDSVSAAEKAARESVDAAERLRGRLAAEEAALSDLLAQDDDGGAPVLEEIQVAAGFETALGAALGDDLDAALDEEASRHWTDLGTLADAPSLPGGVDALAGQVKAPAALARRLSQIGVVADAETAIRLQKDLKVGQRLVSRDGGLWRWDGLRIRPGTATAAAKRLEQRNRLADVADALAKAERDLADAKASAESKVSAAKQSAEVALAAARQAAETLVANTDAQAEGKLDDLRGAADASAAALSEAAATATECRRAQQDAYDRAGSARSSLARLEQQVSESRSRLAALAGETDRIAAERDDAKEREESAQKAVAVLEDANILRERLARSRAALAELRARQVEKRSAFDRLEREAKARGERLNAILAEEQSWKTRSDGAARRQTDLKERHLAAGRELTSLEARPAEIAEQRSFLQSKIAELEEERKAAADKLAEAELAQRDMDHALKAAELSLAEARETRVRREAEVEQAEQAMATVTERVAEKLECAPEDALAQSGLAEDADLPDQADVEQRIERLSRERDNIGPVNLRAEQEAQELEEQIASMKTERDDLVAAISRLRQGINALNREGRERLLRAFEEVDTHFRQLFVELFGGGEAHLKLTESDDPLQAGLEIMASPPGKKMQILSLLSGGEQALTALALLFGVFLTNPAPICVLDEVDAPLDDTNVDRFCQMLDKIAKAGTTRFLVVTHHRMTMARVDRLFGVTMAERGVSQLVSVDLRQAERMREAG